MVIIIQSFKNYKNLSKLFKLSDSKHFQLKLNIVSITIKLQNNLNLKCVIKQEFYFMET